MECKLKFIRAIHATRGDLKDLTCGPAIISCPLPRPPVAMHGRKREAKPLAPDPAKEEAARQKVGEGGRPIQKEESVNKSPAPRRR